MIVPAVEKNAGDLSPDVRSGRFLRDNQFNALVLQIFGDELDLRRFSRTFDTLKGDKFFCLDHVTPLSPAQRRNEPVTVF